jgi:hypothetical protein
MSGLRRCVDTPKSRTIAKPQPLLGDPQGRHSTLLPCFQLPMCFWFELVDLRERSRVDSHTTSIFALTASL